MLPALGMLVSDDVDLTSMQRELEQSVKVGGVVEFWSVEEI